MRYICHYDHCILGCLRAAQTKLFCELLNFSKRRPLLPYKHHIFSLEIPKIDERNIRSKFCIYFGLRSPDQSESSCSAQLVDGQVAHWIIQSGAVVCVGSSPIAIEIVPGGDGLVE